MNKFMEDQQFIGPETDVVQELLIRRLADLGYQRNAKKCREKFENVYKYHKRTKEGRASKQDGNKTYRFFNELEALEMNQLTSLPSITQAKGIQATAPATRTNMTTTTTTTTTKVAVTANPTSISPSPISTRPPSVQIHGKEITSTSTSSSFDEESKGSYKKKRKLTAFFENLMKEVNEKQEMLEKKFMEAIKKHENQLLLREEEWKRQELAILNREHEINVQERNLKAAKDAAVIAFLQEVSQQQSAIVPSVRIQESKPIGELEKIVNKPRTEKVVDMRRTDNGNENYTSRSLSSSRWPKEEIEALIRIRTSLEIKYQESMPKGPLWEEISCAMKKLGYNRSSKRCKEKWENINKYFKKVKESNKRRPEDSKTCPYFEQLEELYREKNDKRRVTNDSANVPDKDACELKPEELVMHMMMHKPAREHKQRSVSLMDHVGLDNATDKNQQEEDEGGGYETTHQSSMEIAS